MHVDTPTEGDNGGGRPSVTLTEGQGEERRARAWIRCEVPPPRPPATCPFDPGLPFARRGGDRGAGGRARAARQLARGALAKRRPRCALSVTGRTSWRARTAPRAPPAVRARVLNPLVLLLAVLASVSLATGDARAAVVMAAMIVLGVGLRFMQEARADAAAEKLRAMIRVTATVLRAGRPREEPLADIVPGDIVQLSAGDMIPADVRILTCRDLFVTQASLTGESLPVEKFETAGESADASALELKNLCFLGTAVESGTATALVVETGPADVSRHDRQHADRRAGADQLRPGRRQFHLAHDPLHRRHGPARLRDQRPHQARLEGGVLLRARRRRRPHARDAADDRVGVPVARRAPDVEEEGHREAPERDPEPRRDGHAVHRQDRDADAGPRHPRTPLRRRVRTKTTGCSCSRT